MRAAVVVLAALLALTSCSSGDDGGDGDSPGDAATVAADLAVAATRSDGDGTGAGGVEGAISPRRPTLLQMPQVTVRLDAVASARTVDVGDVGLEGGEGVPDEDDVAAPDGGDLVSADLTLTPGAFAAAPEASEEGPWRLSAVVDGEERPIALELTLSAGSTEPVQVTVMVAAPPEVPVYLQVTDVGRSARLDLREAVAAPDSVSQAVSTLGGAVSDLGPAQEVKGRAESTADTFEAQVVGPSLIVVSAALDQATAGAYAWVPGEGWASRGRQWLVVQTPVTVFGIVTGVQQTLSVPARAITAAVPSGRPARSVFALEATATDVLDGTSSPLVFEVQPAESYRVRVDVGRGALPGSRWVRRPAPVEFDVTLAP